MRQRVYDKWLILIFKGVFGLLSRMLALALCSPVLHTQRCFGAALAWVALALCSPVLRIQRCFGVALAWGCPCFMQPHSSYSKVFWGCSRVGCSCFMQPPFFIFKGVFKRLQRGVRPAFMQPHQRLMMPLVADVQRLSWQTGRHLAMSALPMSAGISRRIMLFLYLPWSGGHFKPGVSCYLLVILLFRQFIFFNSELEGVFAHSLFFFHFNK